MATVKRIVCLANSRKHSGGSDNRCIAGIELSGHRAVGWIRPVSSREREEVSKLERQYQGGVDPRVLDIIDVPLLEPRPKGHQQENWLLDPERHWVKIGNLAWSDLHRLADPVAPLWINGGSTIKGLNDEVPLSRTTADDGSLRLIRVGKLILSVFYYYNRRRVQGRFRYDGTQYWLWVTDPQYERAYLAKPDGEYEIGESFLTVSLGEPYKDACYKLIAAIIERGGGTGA